MNYLEEMVLKAKSVEDLNKIKKMIRRSEALKKKSVQLKKCTHPVVFYLDYDIEYQETTYKYMCLECKKIVDGANGYKITPKNISSIEERENIAKKLSEKYNMLPKKSRNEDIVNYYNFLEKNDLVSEDKIIDSYKVYKKIIGEC